MNGIDRIDQMNQVYNVKGNFRFVKWWWSIFCWGLNCAISNSYIIYKAVCADEGVQPMPHYRFQLKIAESLYIEAEKADDVDAAVKKSKAKARKESLANKGKKGTKTNQLRENIRLVKDKEKWPKTRFVGHDHPLDETKTRNTRCQYCRWEKQEKPSRSTVRCRTCRVILCHKHWNIWHGLGDGK